MTKRTTGALLAAATLATASALPLAAGAASRSTAPTQTYVLDSVATRDYQAGGYDGVLRLTIAPDGTVLGTYRDAYDGAPKVVSGGLQPSGRIWLNVHEFGLLYGTFRNGVLHTTQQDAGPDALHFDATPAP